MPELDLGLIKMKKKKKEGNDLKHCDIDVIEVNVRKELARGITDSQSWS